MLRRNFLLLGLLPFYMYIRKSKAERVPMDVVRGQRKNQIMLDEDCLPKTNIKKMFIEWEFVGFGPDNSENYCGHFRSV